MLLGRTANGLYWMNRYIERTENMARLIDAGLRMALTRSQDASEEWNSVLLSAGAAGAFAAKHSDYTAENVADFLLRDMSNPSSAVAAIETARNNARMVRTALTRETWESINEAWMAMKRMLESPIDQRELPSVLDAVKRETALIRGSFYGTMLRNEIFDFAQLGTYVERADNTARILDVKYYVLLPSVAWVGSSLDNYQWESILRSVAAHRSYRWVYEAEYKPTNIAEYLILNVRMPRSLTFSYRFLAEHLKFLGEDYGTRQPAQEIAERTYARLRGTEIKDIFETGLHEFLADFIQDNNRLGDQVAQDFGFY
ncbi:alpha-E domain-containing protein [Aminobacter sp. AP02]|uniref:alpha-E domain-containing protein n=1 Tax=Aminobacter sp. AP02 TaxID=2135737 RepID=UPI000D6BF1FC|nr:alpha-E domain-containing protein [Aminobacter sp. AP02]PWK69707.1 putative alpha-E superfamily protein [Aminobacter sp. AP02]